MTRRCAVGELHVIRRIEVASICERIKKRRRVGRTVCAVFHGKEIIPRGARLRDFGYQDIPDDMWVRVNRREALKVIVHCLTEDLAYGAKVMSAKHARELGEAFLSNFDEDARFLTNSRYFRDDFRGSAFSWNPISGSAIDTGIVVESGGLAGILWVEDED